jgi:hypothetical protein
LKVLQKAAKNWHPVIKCAVAEALPSLVAASVAAHHEGAIKWTKGDVKSSGLDKRIVFIASAVLKELITLMEDHDNETVGKACRSIQSVIEQCGPGILGPVKTDCVGKATDLLRKRALCQLELDDGHDEFMTSVCGLVGSFARVMGDQFTPFLPDFLAAIVECGKSPRPPSDRSIAMVCLGVIAREVDVSAHWESTYFPAILARLGDPVNDVKHNAACSAGMCCESLGEKVGDKYSQLLPAITQLFSLDRSSGKSSAATVDNAAAAVARMILACPQKVPMSQVLPALLGVLPLKSDMTENETVYNCLFTLQKMPQADFVANRDKVRKVYTAATGNGSTVDKEIQRKITLALEGLK